MGGYNASRGLISRDIALFSLSFISKQWYWYKKTNECMEEELSTPWSIIKLS
jgi:hypothetical protein